MKKTTVVLLVVSLVLLLTGCGVKDKIEQKVGEKIVETAVEKAVGDKNTKVDIDGDKITVKGKDGGSVSFGGTEWPDIDYLPEFKKGDIISSTNDGEGNVMLVFEEVKQEDFEDYINEIKKDFSNETNEMQVEEYLLYEGKNDEGALVAIQYYIEDQSLTIIGNSKTE